MKIRRFDELNDKTYIKAADKLRQLGHKDRSNSINDYVVKKNLPKIENDDDYIIDGNRYKYIGIVHSMEKAGYSNNRSKNVDDFIKQFEGDDFIKFKFQIAIRFSKDNGQRNSIPKSFTIGIHVLKRGGQSNLIINIGPLSFDRKSALKFKRNIVPSILGEVPFSDLVSLLGLETELYSKVIESIEGISVNVINSSESNISIFSGSYMTDGKPDSVTITPKYNAPMTDYERIERIRRARERRTNEELSPETYREAGKKLLKMNHIERGHKLFNYAGGEVDPIYKYKIDGDHYKFKEIYYSINYQDVEDDGTFDIDKCYRTFDDSGDKEFDVVIESYFSSSDGEATIATFIITVGLNGKLLVKMRRYHGELFDDRASAILFKKEILPTFFDIVPLSDFFILLNLDVNAYKRIVDSIEGIGINNLYTDRQNDSDELVLLNEPSRKGRYKKNESFNENVDADADVVGDIIRTSLVNLIDHGFKLYLQSNKIGIVTYKLGKGSIQVIDFMEDFLTFIDYIKANGYDVNYYLTLTEPGGKPRLISDINSLKEKSSSFITEIYLKAKISK